MGPWRIRLVGVIIAMNAISACARPELPRVRAGVLDLRAYDFPDGAPVALTGDWRFTWNTLDSGSARASPTSVFFPVPGMWNDRRAGDRTLGGTGQAVYECTVLLKEARPLAIRTAIMNSAFTLYVDGKVAGGGGRPGPSREFELPDVLPRIIPVAPSGPVVRLGLVVSNHHHHLGGIWDELLLGPEEQVRGIQTDNVAFELFLCGALLIFGLYHVQVFFLRREELLFLLFGVLCLIVSVRTLLTGEGYLFRLVPAPWDWIRRAEYLSVITGTGVAHAYFRKFFPDEYNRGVFLLFSAIFTGLIGTVLFTDPGVFTSHLVVHMIIMAIVTIYLFLAVLRAVLNGRPGAMVVLVGVTLFDGFVAHDLLYSLNFFRSRFLAPVGMFLLICSQAFLLARTYADSFRRQAELTRRLEFLLVMTRDLAALPDPVALLREAALRIQKILQARGPVVGSLVYGESLRWTADPDGRESVEHAPFTTPGAEGPAPPGALKIPVELGGTLLAVLEIYGVAREKAAGEAEFIMGASSSLALALDNQRRGEREKLALVGQFASEIVHDINHHCQVIDQRIRMNRRGDVPIESTLRGLQEDAGFLRNMALDILDFAGAPVLNRQGISLHEFCESLREVLEAMMREYGVRLDLAVAGEERVWIDAGRLRRVAYNLALNAAQVMGPGGSFGLRAAVEDGLVYLVFQDNGPGMDKAARDWLFRGLATGNAPSSGSGRGIGLAVVRRIVQAHEGEIGVDSRPGQGTRITVILPAGAPG